MPTANAHSPEEIHASGQPKENTTPDTTPDTKKARNYTAQYYAVVQPAEGAVVIVRAKDQKLLKEQISDPSLKVIGVFRGRMLKVQEKRTVAFSS
jgi:hypothetical protein